MTTTDDSKQRRDTCAEQRKQRVRSGHIYKPDCLGNSEETSEMTATFAAYTAHRRFDRICESLAHNGTRSRLVPEIAIQEGCANTSRRHVPT